MGFARITYLTFPDCAHWGSARLWDGICGTFFHVETVLKCGARLVFLYFFIAFAHRVADTRFVQDKAVRYTQ